MCWKPTSLMALLGLHPDSDGEEGEGRQIFDNPEEGLDVLMQIVIVGMLSYTVYVMLFPEGQYAHYDDRKKRSARIIYDDLRDHFSSHKGPLIDNLALYVNKGIAAFGSLTSDDDD